MAINVTCRCGKKLAVRDELAGRKGKCPACGSVLEIPALPSAGSPPPAPAAPPPARPAPKPAPAKPAGASPAPARPSPEPEKKSSSRIAFPPPPARETGAGGAGGGAKPGKTCHNCGAPVKAQEIFCVKCGVSLEQREQSKLAGRKEVSVGFNRGPEANPWKGRAILAAVVLVPVLAGLVWHSVSEGAAGKEWRERTQDGAAIPRPKDIDELMNRDPREQLKIARIRITNDIAAMGGWSFATRRGGYEDFYHLVVTPEGLSAYRPDLGWWSRGSELGKIEEWWEENSSGLYWDPMKRRFGAKKRPTPAGQ